MCVINGDYRAILYPVYQNSDICKPYLRRRMDPLFLNVLLKVILWQDNQENNFKPF